MSYFHQESSPLESVWIRMTLQSYTELNVLISYLDGDCNRKSLPCRCMPLFCYGCAIVGFEAGVYIP